MLVQPRVVKFALYMFSHRMSAARRGPAATAPKAPLEAASVMNAKIFGARHTVAPGSQPNWHVLHCGAAPPD